MFAVWEDLLKRNSLSNRVVPLIQSLLCPREGGDDGYGGRGKEERKKEEEEGDGGCIRVSFIREGYLSSGEEAEDKGDGVGGCRVAGWLKDTKIDVSLLSVCTE